MYTLAVDASTIAVLCYIGLIDFRTYKISNESLLVLLVLYLLHALLARPWSGILMDFLVSLAVFAIMLWFYARRLVGGGDVKLLSVACLWVGMHCALAFSVLLLVLVTVHLAVARFGWASSRRMGDGRGIPYAPAVAGAWIGVILLSCA